VPTGRHLLAGRYVLQTGARNGPQTAAHIRAQWLTSGGPENQPEEAFFNSLIDMLIDPGGYLLKGQDERLSLTADGEMVAHGGDFIFGR
jgi:hypothetical protein